MWLAERREQQEEQSENAVMLGTVTVEKRPVAVWLDGERRGVELLGPVGYHWVPRKNQKLLVLKAGEHQYYAAGETMPEIEGLKPGEIMIATGMAGIKLKPDGTVDIIGTLTYNGMPIK